MIKFQNCLPNSLQVKTQPMSCPDFRQALGGAYMESCKGKEPKIVVAISYLHWKETQET